MSLRVCGSPKASVQRYFAYPSPTSVCWYLTYPSPTMPSRILVGPETGCRKIDKLDLLLFPIVLLLRVSPLLFTLLPSASRLLCNLYDYCFYKSHSNGFQSKVIGSLSYVYYIILRVAMISLFWLYSILGWVLLSVYYLWVDIVFWPRFYWRLFCTGAKGRSIWSVVADPEDVPSSQQKLKNPSPAGWIHPLWSSYMVFLTYQVHGAYTHLYQHQNHNVTKSLVESAGPALPPTWDPLHLAIPYEYLMVKLIKPPDCYLHCELMIRILLGLYSVPLVRGALHLKFLCICSFLKESMTSVKSRIALVTTQDFHAGNTPVSSDTDGIPFIINNSVTCIICSERSLFVGNHQPESYHVETVQARVAQKQYVGTI
jgi:hypothetical protein